ncbi:hypothetical protein HZU75_11295 [Chitinibacter fontanus]|uniref:Uncharacterized protein n=1 Tax=Chitinibacter fontanus TaxID=1737446 RepID=A0A7D5ZDI1_9NEIS|nr:hypothetical protein [Chitinibacter fontanus]QLI82065.1 hypothetical protein HZU75_11295 [Chitinibacter fontanus]
MKIRIVVLSSLLIITLAITAVFVIQQERERDGHWPWPLNGQIINNSNLIITVWDDDHGNYTLGAQQRSSKALDIDHALEPSTGRWCKLGAHTLIVNPDGRFANCSCYSLSKGRPCIQF